MGKASIIYVMGLGMLMGYALMNVNAASTDAVSNFSKYYGRTMAHNIASSGANIGCSAVFWDSTYSTSFVNVPMMGGKMNVSFSVSGNKKFVTSIGRIDMGPYVIVDTVRAELRNESLAKYAWMTNNEANRHGQPTSWVQGDTAWGTAHTNDKFNINGNDKPVFMKKATAWEAAVAKNNKALWAGGYQWGIKIPYPTDLSNFQSAAQDTAGGGRVVLNNNAKLDFLSGGGIRLRVPYNGSLRDTTYANANAFTSKGAFAVVGGNLQVEGTFEGDVAVGALKSGGNGGTVFITGNVRYKTDPRINPASTDYLGIYAVDSISVTYDNSNPSAYYNRMVDASLFSLKGEVNVMDHDKYAPRGQLTTFGAFMQFYRGAIGKGVGAGLLHGYNKNFKYDDRLVKHPPKFYPATGRYTLYAWKEN